MQARLEKNSAGLQLTILVFEMVALVTQHIRKGTWGWRYLAAEEGR